MTQKQTKERRNYRLDLERREFLLIVEAQSLFQRRAGKLVSLNALMRGLIDGHMSSWDGCPAESAVEVVSTIQDQTADWMRHSAEISLNLTLDSKSFAKFASIKAALEAKSERAFSVKSTVLYVAAACVEQLQDFS